MKKSIQILSIITLATTLSYGQGEPAKDKKGPNPEKMFKKLDADANGSLSLEEFKASPMGTKLGDKAEARFGKLDADQKDGVSLEEFTAGMKKGGKGKEKAPEKEKEE